MTTLTLNLTDPALEFARSIERDDHVWVLADKHAFYECLTEAVRLANLAQQAAWDVTLPGDDDAPEGWRVA